MTWQLTITFFGIACFSSRGSGFDVLLPDGERHDFPITRHEAYFWIRPADKQATSSPGWNGKENNFKVEKPCTLSIEHIDNSGGVDATRLHRRIPSLQRSDPAFEIGDPRTILTTRIDGGTLVAQRYPRGAFGVKWVVDVADGKKVKLNLDTGAWLELAEGTTHVTIANVPQGGDGSHSVEHFRLYRQLTKKKEKDKELPVLQPPDCADLVEEEPEPAPVSIRTPIVDCSGATYP